GRVARAGDPLLLPAARAQCAAGLRAEGRGPRRAGLRPAGALRQARYRTRPVVLGAGPGRMDRRLVRVGHVAPADAPSGPADAPRRGLERRATALARVRAGRRVP